MDDDNIGGIALALEEINSKRSYESEDWRARRTEFVQQQGADKVRDFLKRTNHSHSRWSPDSVLQLKEARYQLYSVQGYLTAPGGSNRREVAQALVAGGVYEILSQDVCPAGLLSGIDEVYECLLDIL